MCINFNIFKECLMFFLFACLSYRRLHSIWVQSLKSTNSDLTWYKDLSSPKGFWLPWNRPHLFQNKSHDVVRTEWNKFLLLWKFFSEIIFAHIPPSFISLFSYNLKIKIESLDFRTDIIEPTLSSFCNQAMF